MVRCLLVFITFATSFYWSCRSLDAQQTLKPRDLAKSNNTTRIVVDDSDSYFNNTSRRETQVQETQRMRMEPQQQSSALISDESKFREFVQPISGEQEIQLESYVRENQPQPQVLQQWPASPMSALRPDPRPTTTNIPLDQADRLISQYSRDWNSLAVTEKPFNWEAPNIRYQPLYFEDVDLERYGHVVRDDYFQSIVSFAHFFTSAALLPLHMRHDPVYSCDYPLGYCRPGNCTNQIFQRPFWSRNRNR